MFKSTRRFLAELSSDTGGNALMITGAAILLLLAAVGGGVDISRAYMTKTNLQSACDAGVLAGRKAMANTGEYTTDAQAKATKMFNFNLNTAASDLSNVHFGTEAHDDGSVTGAASAEMPTVVMHIFSFRKFDLSVDCSAELQMASADIVFVLDVTKSMNCLDTNWSCAFENDEKSSSRLAALRQAVKDFHLTVAKAVIDKESTIIRYAFVPYSGTVNVSELVSDGKMPATWFEDSPQYWTTVYKFDKAQYAVITDINTNIEDQKYSSNIKESDCTKYGVNTFPNNVGNPSPVGNPPNKVTTTTYSFKSWEKKSGSGSNSLGECWRTKTTNEKTYNQTPYAFQYTGSSTTKKWSVSTAGLIGSSTVKIASTITKDVSTVPYTPVQGQSVPTSLEYDKRSLGNLTGTSGITFTNVNWTGCIEERGTAQGDDMDPIPSNAWDLNMEDEPVAGNNNSMWKAHWRAMSATQGTFDQCPSSPIKQFQIASVDSATDVPTWLNTYLTNLKGAGHTYHDLGMIWAARIGSTTGLFKDNVNNVIVAGEAVERKSVARHVIFMTDGVMKPAGGDYTAYSLENRFNRVAASGTSDTNLITHHNNRFLAACRKAEEDGYTVWVISFGEEITVEMQNCATAGKSYLATDTATLSNTFKFIAGQVADLRINQ